MCVRLCVWKNVAANQICTRTHKHHHHHHRIFQCHCEVYLKGTLALNCAIIVLSALILVEKYQQINVLFSFANLRWRTVFVCIDILGSCAKIVYLTSFWLYIFSFDFFYLTMQKKRPRRIYFRSDFKRIEHFALCIIRAGVVVIVSTAKDSDFFEYFDTTINLPIIFRSVLRTDKIGWYFFLVIFSNKISIQFEICTNFWKKKSIESLTRITGNGIDSFYFHNLCACRKTINSFEWLNDWWWYTENYTFLMMQEEMSKFRFFS